MKKKPDIQKLSEQFRYEAQHFNKLGKRSIYLGVFLSLLALVTKKIFPELSDLDWILVGVSFIVQILAQLLNICSRKAHYRSRNGYRWFLISTSIEDEGTKSDAPLIDLNQKLTTSGYPNVTDEEETPYFNCVAPKGIHCFLCNLHESVFHTKMIMKKDHSRKILSGIIMIASVIIIMTAALTLSVRSEIDPYLVTLIAISVLIPLISELLDSIKTHDPISELERMQLQLEELFELPDAKLYDHLSILLYTIGEYYAITASQDILNSNLYQKNKVSFAQKYLELIKNLKK